MKTNTLKVHIEDVLDDKGEVKGRIFVESDEMQFVIKEYTGKTNTDSKGVEREVFKTLGYYPTVGGCLNRLVKMKVMQSTATTLQELHADFLRIEAFIASKFA